LGQGRGNAKSYLEENPSMAKEIREKIFAKRGLSPEGAPLPPVEVVAEEPVGEGDVIATDERARAARGGGSGGETEREPVQGAARGGAERGGPVPSGAAASNGKADLAGVA
jgi:hypothetical protein